jgi:hypothetical protein
MADLPKFGKSELAVAEHAVDFDPPICNIWKQQEKTRETLFLNARWATSSCPLNGHFWQVRFEPDQENGRCYVSIAPNAA